MGAILPGSWMALRVRPARPTSRQMHSERWPACSETPQGCPQATDNRHYEKSLRGLLQPVLLSLRTGRDSFWFLRYLLPGSFIPHATIHVVWRWLIQPPPRNQGTREVVRGLGVRVTPDADGPRRGTK